MLKSPQLFPSSCRLRKRKEFLALQKTGRRHHTQFFTIFTKKNSFSNCRVGITVSTKVHKRAVVRNYLKRVVREVFRREMLPAMHMTLDIVVVAKTQSNAVLYSELRSDLLKWKEVIEKVNLKNSVRSAVSN